MKRLTTLVVLLLMAGAGAYATVIDIIEGPEDQYGLGYDGTYLWVGSNDDDNTVTSYYKVDPEDGDILETYSIHGDEIRGIAFDEEYLYLYSWDFGGGNTDYIYTVDPADGSVVDSVEGPWTTNDYCGGMTCFDGYLYISRYYPDNPTEIHQVDIETGESVGTITSPCTQPQGVAHDDTSLWVVGDDFNNEDAMIYHINPDDGAIYESYWAISEDQGGTVNPRGLTMNEDNLLWMAANWSDSPTNRGLYLIQPGDEQPIISVSVEEIDFGFVALNETAEIDFTIENIGTMDLILDSAVFAGAFDYSLDPNNPVIEPDGILTVTAGFTPEEWGLDTTTAVIYSNDPINPEVSVFAQGFGVYAMAGPEASTTDISFGSVWIPQETDGIAAETLYIYNPGLDDLVLESMTFDGDAEFDSEDITPLTLAVMETTRVVFFFEPMMASDYEATVEFTNDNTDDLLVIQLSGHGEIYEDDFGNYFWWRVFAEQPKVTAILPFGDADGDGVSDVLAVHDEAMAVCISGASSSDPVVLWTYDTGASNFNYGYPLSERGMTAPGDLDGDGAADVVIGCGGGNEHVYAFSGADGSILWSYGDDQDYDLGDFNEVHAFVDITGDDVPEILAAAGDNSTGDGRRSVYCFNGATGAIVWDYMTGGSTYTVCHYGDVTGDDIPDVAAANGGDSNHQLALLDGSDGSVINTLNTDGPIWQVIAGGDLNDDGVPDIVTADFYEGITGRDGDNGQQLWQYPTGSIFTEVELIGDVNDDGYNDFAAVTLTADAPLISGEDGSQLWLAVVGDNTLRVGRSEDLDNDLIPDVLLGSLDGTVRAVSGVDGETIFITSSNSGAVETVHGMDDLDHNGSPEVLYGSRNGGIGCLSGGNLIEDFAIIRHYPGYIELEWGSNGPEWWYYETPDSVFNDGTDTLFIQIEDIVWVDGWIDPDFMNPQAPDMLPPGESGEILLHSEGFEGEGNLGYMLLTTNAPGAESDTVWINGILGVDEDDSDLPDEFVLEAPYPNPFNSTVRIGYGLPQTAEVSLRVFDLLGREVASLVRGVKPAGRYEAVWRGVSVDGRPVASGMYFVQFKAANRSFVQAVRLVK